MAKYPHRQSCIPKLEELENQLQDKCKLAKANYDEKLVKNIGFNTRKLYIHQSYL